MSYGIKSEVINGKVIAALLITVPSAQIEISQASLTLTPPEQQLSILNQELLAVKFALTTYGHYIIN